MGAQKDHKQAKAFDRINNANFTKTKKLEPFNFSRKLFKTEKITSPFSASIQFHYPKG